MDITEKMVSFQIIQNVLILKRTLVVYAFEIEALKCIQGLVGISRTTIKTKIEDFTLHIMNTNDSHGK